MRFFILDDDANVVHILRMIIEDKELGTIIGEATDGDTGLKKIRSLAPDIVLIDLLMPGIDGLTIVKKIKEEDPDIEFIMISQVHSKDMIEKAYRYGVEYFINKPINAIEVEIIIKKVIERVEIDKALLKVWKKFDTKSLADAEKSDDFSQEKLNDILRDLGIIGENGTDDIITTMKYMVDKDINFKRVTMRELFNMFTDKPRSMEQRIRRTINMAMTNIANLGLEDYMNDIFVDYSNTLFDFEQVRKEMEYIRGNSKKGGSSNIKKFLIGLSTYCK